MKSFFCTLLFFGAQIMVFGQVGINQASPDASSALDIVSTTKGVLIPRMTEAERNSITVSAARDGLLVYVSDQDKFSFYDATATAWKYLTDDAVGLVDDDGDTMVEVEQNADEDKIRFTLNNTAAGVIDKTDHNTAIGRSSGENLTALDGLRNTLYGSGSGQALTTGDDNVILGYNAGNAFNTESDNVAIGSGALNTETSDEGLVAVGYNALATSDGGAKNTAVGYNAGTAITTGDANTIMGYNSLPINTDGGNNVVIGNDAAVLATSPDWNVLIGTEVASAMTTATGTVAIGFKALNSVQGPLDNVAIGYLAGEDVTSGNNVLIGAYAGADGGAGQANAYIGFGAGRYNSTGSDNVFIGYETGEGVFGSSSGARNVGVGLKSLEGLTTGNDNTAVGNMALDVTTDGTRNVAIGTHAGGASTSDDDNTFVGNNAGVLNNGGAQNTLVGSAAGDNITTGDNNIVIGYNIDAVSATGSNQLNIGNTIYGDLSTDFVGIGTASPSVLLDVNGTIKTGLNGTDGSLQIYSEQGGTDYTYTINPHAAASQNVTLTLPPDDGAANQALTTDGAGALSWADGVGNTHLQTGGIAEMESEADLGDQLPHYTLVYADKSVSVSTMAIYCSGYVGATTYDIGIYNHDKTKIEDGTISVSAEGIATGSLDASVSLTAGTLYWFAVQRDGGSANDIRFNASVGGTELTFQGTTGASTLPATESTTTVSSRVVWMSAY